MEQLVLEQFSAEPPFGISAFASSPQFNTPFVLQNGTQLPNNGGGVIQQTPNTPCFDPSGPNGCVDWSLFRSILLFGEFQPHLRTQYAEQYNLTVERQLSASMLLRVAYVGTQAHHLLASQDLNYGNPQTCLDINNIPGQSCGTFSSDSSFSFTVPAGTTLPYALYSGCLGEARMFRAPMAIPRLLPLVRLLVRLELVRPSRWLDCGLIHPPIAIPTVVRVVPRTVRPFSAISFRRTPWPIPTTTACSFRGKELFPRIVVPGLLHI